MFALQLHSKAPTLPTFHNQLQLPRLPVPALRSTLNKYLQSLEPLIADEQLQKNTVPAIEIEKRRIWANEFEQGLGAICQQRLIDLDRTSPHNWLDDNFWLRKAYLESRDPLIINSNWWLALRDDENVPRDVRNGFPDCAISPWQVRRGAWVVSRLLQFKDLLAREAIPPDTTRSGPLCMSHYNRIFNLCRIPLLGCDALTRIYPKDSQEGGHILVMVKDWFYILHVCDNHGQFVSVDEIEMRLHGIVRDIGQQAERAIPLGLLTSDNRDNWARNREYLLALSPRNRDSLSAIESAIAALSLDDYTLPPAKHSSYTSITNPVMDAHLCNVRSGREGRNRWFDKTLTLCVENNSRLGMTGEHSPCDALIPSILGDYIVAVNMEPGKTAQEDSGGEGWERLDWVVDSRIMRECDNAGQRAKKLIADSDDSLLWFEDYATDWIRNAANLAPDAYIQMALQLAWFKNQNTFTATYETASTRIFTHGRTDVIRSLSTSSRQFVLAMVDPSTSQTTRRSLLDQAIKYHNTYTREASTGKGIDRHLMGLYLVMRPGESSPLFNDPLYRRSQDWKLSTSGLSAGDRFIGTGFGTPLSDGYGINYLAGANVLKFGIESKHSCPSTSTQRFKCALVDSLREMRALCENTGISTDLSLARL